MYLDQCVSHLTVPKWSCVYYFDCTFIWWQNSRHQSDFFSSIFSWHYSVDFYCCCWHTRRLWTFFYNNTFWLNKLQVRMIQCLTCAKPWLGKKSPRLGPKPCRGTRNFSASPVCSKKFEYWQIKNMNLWWVEISLEKKKDFFCFKCLELSSKTK